MSAHIAHKRILGAKASWLVATMALAVIALFLTSSPAVAQEDTQRCEGTVTDYEGNPLQGVTITFHDIARNQDAQPVKTSKKGKYAHNTIGANTSSGWDIRAVLEGHKIVRITLLTVRSDGEIYDDETYMVGSSQEGLHAVHVPAQARQIATSRGKCVVDFVMASDEKFNEAYQMLRKDVPVDEAEEGQDVAVAEEPPPPPSKSSLDLARELIAKQQFDQAVEPARKAVEEEPDNPVAHYRLGQSLLKTKDLAGAEPELKKAHELDATLSGLNFELGMLYIEKGRLVQAVPYFEEELEVNPDSATVLMNLGKLYADTEQYDKAIATLERLVELEPDAIEHYGTLAQAYKSTGDAAMERQTYERMGAQDPTGMAFYNLGTMLYNNSEMTQAAEAYERAIQQSPENALAHYQLGFTYVNLARFEDAIKAFEAYIKLDPKSDKAAEAKSLVAELKKMSG